jgi:hypothetical protein
MSRGGERAALRVAESRESGFTPGTRSVEETMAKVCVPLLILAACSGSTTSGGSSSLSGAGAFTPNFQIATFTDGGDFPNTAGVNIASVNSSPTCAVILDGGPVGVIGIAVGIGISADGGPLQIADYTFVDPNGPVASGNSAYLSLAMFDDAGSNGIASSSSGTLHLTGIGSSLAGNFSAVLYNLADGGVFGTLSGTFDAPVCFTPE